MAEKSSRLCSPPMATKSSEELNIFSICTKCALLISGASKLCAMAWAPLYRWTRITSRLLVYISFFLGRVRFPVLPLVILCPLDSQLFDHAVRLLRPARSLHGMGVTHTASSKYHDEIISFVFIHTEYGEPIVIMVFRCAILKVLCLTPPCTAWIAFKIPQCQPVLTSHV